MELFSETDWGQSEAEGGIWWGGVLEKDAEHGSLSYFPSLLSFSYKRLKVMSTYLLPPALPQRAMAAQKISTKQKRSEKNPDASLICPQCEYF